MWGSRRVGCRRTWRVWPTAGSSPCGGKGRYAYYRVADPRVAELVLLARSLAAENVAALSECVRIDAPGD
jgi:hypothetical protein